MSRPRCPHTADLVSAVRFRGTAPAAPAAERAAHAASCRECADALLVASFLAGEAAAALAEAAPPDPAVVLWRARRRQREQTAARALRPIAVWERLAGALAAAAGAAVGFSWLGGAGIGGPGSVPLAAAAGELASALPVIGVALLLAAAGGGVYLAWADE